MRTILQRAGGKRLFFNSWKISKASAAVLIFFCPLHGLDGTLHGGEAENHKKSARFKQGCVL